MVVHIAVVIVVVLFAFLIGCFLGANERNRLREKLGEKRELIEFYKQQVDFLRVELAQEQDRNKDKEWFTP